VLARAIIRDVYEREAAARGLALVMMVMSFAPAISPAAGAYLAEWLDWRAIFLLLGTAGAIVLVATMARLPETNHHRVRLDLSGMAGSYAVLLRSPAFLGFALCSACTSASWFTFIASAPYLVSQALGEPPSTYGLMILLPMAGYLLGNAAAARFAFRLGSLHLMILGRALAFAAGILMALWCGTMGLGIWVMFVPMALASIGDGLSQPATMAAGLSTFPRIAGTASGLMGFLQMTVAALGTIGVALLPADGGIAMLVTVVGFMGLALGFGIFAARQPPIGAHPVLAGVAATRSSPAAAEGN
jgi:MFS transporter, DHA1 family, multidrug resistance protein